MVWKKVSGLCVSYRTWKKWVFISSNIGIKLSFKIKFALLREPSHSPSILARAKDMTWSPHTLDHMLITESDIYGTWQFKHWGLLFSGKKDTKTKTSRESKGTSKFKRFCKGKLVLENELKWTLISIFITKKKPSEVYNR